MAHTTSDGPTGQRAGAARPAGSALVAILLAVAGGAWLISARLAPPDMRLGVLTGTSPMAASSQMGMPGALSMGLGRFIATWVVMMVAMMVPAFVLAVRMGDTWARTKGQPGGATACVLAGYLLVWSAVGGIAYLYLALQALQGGLWAGRMTALRTGAVLLVVAGVYQLTPPKQACLRHCRSACMGVASPVRTRAGIPERGAGRTLARGVLAGIQLAVAAGAPPGRDDESRLDGRRRGGHLRGEGGARR